MYSEICAFMYTHPHNIFQWMSMYMYTYLYIKHACMHA